MRNLKRTLSLLLTAAMLIGMMVVGASAASSSDFTDSDEITNIEAAQVMTALGVFEGTDSGAFDPNGTLTREQAAAIICRMLLGEDAEELTTNSVVFSDVSADRWSAGYIGYCAQQGILAGANVIMPNLSPPGVREKYLLYDNKLCTGAEAAESLDRLKAQMEKGEK